MWRNSFLCKITAALSILSSESSVFLVTLISFDRFLGIAYPFGNHVGLGKTWTVICVLMCWSISTVISIVPVIVQQSYPDVFQLSEVCVGIPIVREAVTINNAIGTEVTTREYTFSYLFNFTSNNYYRQGWSNPLIGDFRLVTTDHVYIDYHEISIIFGYRTASYFSIIVFIGVNLVCFIAIAVLYCIIFYIARKSSLTAGSSTRLREFRMAMKMSAVVLTDFLCWVPLAFVCILVQCGLITVSPDMYAWTVGLILPINSVINPFLYTLAIIISEH